MALINTTEEGRMEHEGQEHRSKRCRQDLDILDRWVPFNERFVIKITTRTTADRITSSLQ
jgi:hypothetical protein